MKRIEQKNTIKKKKHEKGRKFYQKGAELLWRWRATRQVTLFNLI